MDCPIEILEAMGDASVTFAAKTKEGLVTSAEKGIAPMMRLLLRDETALEGAFVADRVIGKATAVLLLYGNASFVHADLMSEHAESLLRENGFAYSYDRLVPYIKNRRQDGMCPMEQTVLEEDDIPTAFEALKQKWLVMQA